MDKDKVRVDLLREWRQERLEDGIRFSYPVPEGARGFYPRGFVRESDSAADFVDWHGLFLPVREESGPALYIFPAGTGQRETLRVRNGCGGRVAGEPPGADGVRHAAKAWSFCLYACERESGGAR